MKVQAAEGPFEGWYLGLDVGSLVLVRERRTAATLHVVEKATRVRAR